MSHIDSRFFKIISHRGYCLSDIKPNSFEAFKMALNSNFGIEVDIRDSLEELKVSHDPATHDSLSLDTLLSFYRDIQSNLCISFNIKADGLQPLLLQKLSEYSISNYFTFDMSVPNTVQDCNAGLKFFLRQSEFETILLNKPNSLYKKCAGIYIDQFSFSSDVLEYNLNSITTHINNDKKICWVSPELHSWGKENNYRQTVWNKLKEIFKSIIVNHEIYLLTDYPKEAEKIFYA